MASFTHTHYMCQGLLPTDSDATLVFLSNVGSRVMSIESSFVFKHQLAMALNLPAYGIKSCILYTSKRLFKSSASSLSRNDCSHNKRRCKSKQKNGTAADVPDFAAIGAGLGFERCRSSQTNITRPLTCMGSC